MALSVPNVEPELHYVVPTPHAPNSKLPVVVYRGVLEGFSYDDIETHMNNNKFKRGGVYGTYKTAHYHSNAHEGYAVTRGSVKYLLGKGPKDVEASPSGEKYGLLMSFKKGDFFILPAGVAHCSVESEGDFEYISYFDESAPKWDMNFCEDEVTNAKTETSRNTPIPQTDPVYGPGGPIPKIWHQVKVQA